MYSPTPRDLTLMAGCARGRSNAQLGVALEAPEGTIKTWLHRLLTRLEVQDAAHLVSLAYQRGWLAGLKPEPRDWLVLRRPYELALHGLAEGLSYGQIACREGISENTVKTNTRRLYRALGITGTPRAAARAVALGYQHGLLHADQKAAAA